MQLVRDKRTKILLGVGAIILFVGVVVRFYPDVTAKLDLSSETASRELTLRKYQKVVKSGEALVGQIEILRKTLARMESGLLGGATPSLAAADIQNVLNSIADKSQVQTKTVRVLKAEPVEGMPYMSVPVEFSVNCETRQLKEILYQIESSAKYLMVQKVRITVVRRGKSEQVQGDVTVVGFMRKT